LYKKNSEKLSFEIKKPIFIVGVPRSGTTLLYQLLAQHPDLGWFSNNILKKLYSEDYLKFVFMRKRIFELRKFPYPPDEFNQRFFLPEETPFEGGRLFRMAFQVSWNPQVSEKGLALLKKIIIETLIQQNKKRFLSKVPRNSMRIPAINTFFPNSKFIHIIRDGRAVVNSLLKRSKENPTGYFGIPLKNSNKNMNQIEKHAIQWNEVIEEIKKASKNLKDGQYMEIKYEDLINSPKEHMKQITKFCELSEFDYVDENNGDVFFKIAKLNEKLFEYKKILTNKNKHHDNDSEIMKYINVQLKKCGYI